MDGFATVSNEGWQAPGHWRQIDGEWQVMTLGGIAAGRSLSPVCHVSYYEADAFARWSGKHLPTEMEWEVAARAGHLNDAFGIVLAVDPQRLCSLSRLPGHRGRARRIQRQVHGQPAGAARLFACNSDGHSRITYRNFFYPHHRWQFTGLRLADYAADHFRIQTRRKARSGDYHECACPRFGQSASFRRADLGIRRRRDRRSVAASETAVAEIFLRRRGLGAVRADHGAAGILSDPHRTRRSCATAAARYRPSFPRARHWWNSARAPPPRCGCC